MRLNRRRFGQVLAGAPLLGAVGAAAESTGGSAPEASRAWFRDARFGMFIHFGLYATLQRGEWVMHRESIPPAEYQKLISNGCRWQRRRGSAT
jgi:alpha-L-fucosidase